jgi:hypothetical protein
MRFVVLVSVCCLFCGCQQGAVGVTRIEPGSECPAGGVRLTTTTTSEIICNGANGPGGVDGAMGTPGTAGGRSLVRQAALPLGDDRCPLGGVVLFVGLDSGADGGVAGDGLLQPGEVTSEEVLCGVDLGQASSFRPPPGDAGTSFIRARGGPSMSAAGTGGIGGEIEIERTPNPGGHLKVWRTGRADASFVVPTLPPGQVGIATVVSTSTEVNQVLDVATGSQLPSTSLFVTAGEDSLFVSQGPGASARPVSSLTLLAGATLTLPSNLTGATSGAPRPIRVGGRCQLDGRITVTDAIQPPLQLNLQCSELVLGPSSVVDALAPNHEVWLTFGAQVRIHALGTIDASARDGASPHGAGRITLIAPVVVAAGRIRAVGTNSSLEEPTRAGEVRLIGDVSNAASIDVSAGDLQGVAMGGPSAGIISMGQRGLDPSAMVRNRGPLIANGGSVLGSPCEPCRGGNGGLIEVAANEVVNDATWVLNGGSSVDLGGGGGTVRVGTTPAMRTTMLFSGTIDASGGAGRVGGEGGFVTISHGGLGGGELLLLGYSLLDVRGGDGIMAGAGGRVWVGIPPMPEVVGGGVAVAADIDSRGGDSTSPDTVGFIGRGGNINIVEGSSVGGWPWQRTLVTGVLRASSGVNGTGAGSVAVVGLSSVEVDRIEAFGRRAGQPGPAILLVQAQSGSVVCRGPIEFSTPAQEDPAFGPTTLTVRGDRLQVLGPIIARGAATASGTSGPGGVVRLLSRLGPTELRVAAPAGIDVSAGSGPVLGARGLVAIDGFDVTSAWTH